MGGGVRFTSHDGWIGEQKFGSARQSDELCQLLGVVFFSVSP